jgi:hypothetical protein
MTVKLSQKDVEDLRNKGFSDKEIQEAVGELEKEDRLNQQYNYTKGDDTWRQQASYSGFSSKTSDDVARWQLELNDILEKAEHILRGDNVRYKDGAVIWMPREDAENNTLNEYGVQLIMKVLSMYINRNTILSDYTEEEVRLKTLDIGKELNNLIFKKSDEMGLITEDKRKEYPMIVREITDVIHSAYARAKDGRERESYRKMISVSQQNQSQQLIGAGQGGGMQVPQKRGILNPMRYVGGKYR